MWSERPSMKPRLHDIQGTDAISLCTYQLFCGFIVGMVSRFEFGLAGLLLAFLFVSLLNKSSKINAVGDQSGKLIDDTKPWDEI